MKRRAFISSTISAGMAGALSVSCGNKQPQEVSSAREESHGKEALLPDTLAGMTLEELREDYRQRLFDRYLPFWDKGAYDDEIGGVMCSLNDDGSIADGEKFIWFQGRGLWVYASLYNNFGKEQRYLERAQKMREFLVKYMYAGNGTWYERLNRDGSVKEGVSKSLYGWFFIANGLQELYKATGNEEDLNLVNETIEALLKAYNNPDFGGVSNLGGYPKDMSFTGCRAQGIHMCFLRLLTQLLSHVKNPGLEKLQEEQVNLIMTKFYNPEYGITNEYLRHDYSRIPGYEDYMLVGHSIEVQWMVMFEAIRTKNRKLFDESKNLIHRYLEIGWDYIFDGLGATHFYVFDGPDRTREKLYGVKEGWAHHEILIALMHVVEFTGEQWAKDWYDKAHEYIVEKFDTECGVWKQSLNRFGGEVDHSLKIRSRWHPKRKDNFHQPRMMMLNLLSLDRMIKNKGKPTPFPV